VKTDLSKFFDHVTRTKVARALKEIRFKPATAFEYACQSTVEKTLGRRDFSLPFGFPQSPLLATLALSRSALGRQLELIRTQNIRVSIYMDDIILSP
jgi:Reverse transcriptase (RNA-dependent DNA polymerase)